MSRFFQNKTFETTPLLGLPSEEKKNTKPCRRGDFVNESLIEDSETIVITLAEIKERRSIREWVTPTPPVTPIEKVPELGTEPIELDISEIEKYLYERESRFDYFRVQNYCYTDGISSSDLVPSVNSSENPGAHDESPRTDSFGYIQKFRELFKHSLGHKTMFQQMRDSVMQMLYGTCEMNFEDYMLLMESSILFMEDIMVCQTKTHIVYALMRYLRMNGRSPRQMCFQMIDWILQDVYDIYDAKMRVQGASDYASWLSKFIEGADVVANSEFMKKTRGLLARVLSVGILSGLDIDVQQHLPEVKTFVKELEEKPIAGGYAIVMSICQYALFIYTKGVEACTLGPWSAFFGSHDRFAKWIAGVEDLKLKTSFLSDPDVLVLSGYLRETLDVSCLNEQCDKLIAESEVFMRAKKSLYRAESDGLQKYICELTQMRVLLTSTRYTMRTRPMPLGIILHGRSNILKSYLTRLMYTMFAKAANTIEWGDKPKLNLVADDEHFYARNANDEYWSKYKSYMWCINFDDIGGTKPDKAQGVPKDVSAVLRVQNNIPYVTEQAALEDKGRIPIQNLLTIGSTNIFHLDVPSYMNDTFANLRRFHFYIDVEVKTEYADATGNIVDTDKIPETDGLLDMWNFTVKKAVPDYRNTLDQRVNVPAKFQVIKTFDNIGDFIQFYNIAVVKHLKQQERALKQSNKIDDVPICSTCLRQTAGEHNCMQVQGFTVNNMFERARRSSSKKAQMVAWMVYMSIRLVYLQISWILYFLSFIVPSTAKYHTDERRMIMRFMVWRFQLGNWYTRHRFKIKVGAIVSILSLIVLGGSIFLYNRKKKNSKKNMETQGNGCIPTPAGPIDAKENPWKNEEVELSSYDITPHISSWTSRPIDAFIKNISNNVLFTWFIDDKNVARKGRILGIGGQIYVTNNHYFVLNDIRALRIMRGNSENGVVSTRTEHICKDQTLVMPDKDLCFLYLPNQPPVKDISKYFLDTLNQRLFKAHYVVRGEDRSLQTREMRVGRLMNDILISDPNAPACEAKHDMYFGSTSVDFAAGECGSPLVMEIANSGYCIAGIHMVTWTKPTGKEAGSVPILRAWVDTAIKHFGPVISPGEVLLNSSSAPKRTLGPLHPKSPLRWIESGDCEIYGSISDRALSKSKVVPTLIGKALIDLTATSALPIVKKCGPPVMGHDWRPKRIALLDCVNTNGCLNYGILKKCVESYWADIQLELPASEWALIQEYDLFTAINGAAGVKYVDKMNRKTSAGFPWCTSKRKFLTPMEPTNGLDEPVDINEEILDRIKLYDARIRSGVRTMAIFNSQLKDEPVSESKMKSGKTRVFSSAPIDYTLLVRKYLLSCVRVIQRNIFVFEAAPGVNAHSLEWESIYKYLTEFGTDRIIAGDYSAFDKTMPPVVIQLAYDILIRMCAKAGYSQEALTAIRALGQDVAFPVSNFFGDIVQFHGSNPSGHPLTVVINSIANSIYMRYAYFIANPERECRTFRQNVRLLTYGDDNICGISKECKFFNHTAIQKSLAECGIRYTMADKEAASVPFIDISEATFLKRGFFHHPGIGAIVAQIEHDSICKMLTTCVKAKGLTMEQHAAEVMRTALSEYFFFDKNVFDMRREEFRTIWNTFDLTLDKSFEEYMPTWGTLFQRFWCATEILPGNSSETRGSEESDAQ